MLGVTTIGTQKGASWGITPLAFQKYVLKY